MHFFRTFTLLPLVSLLCSCCCYQTTPPNEADPPKNSQISGEKAKKTAVLVHGLNTKPGIMNDIQTLFQDNGYATIQVVLPGHGHSKDVENPLQSWEAAVLDGMQRGRSLAGDQPLVAVGFSLGGSLLALAASGPTAPITERMVLIAPALGLRIPLLLLRMGNIPLLGDVPISSIAPPSIRRWCSIPLKWYGVVPQILDLLDDPTRAKKLQSIATSLLLNPRDEVISPSATADWIHDHSLQAAWNVESVSGEPGKAAEFEHNLVEHDSLDEKTWIALSKLLIGTSK